jgi:hypothetical protein
MTNFADGPAAGTVLALRRAPLFLRAVQDVGSGKWDALDQLHDEPELGETVVVYRKVEDRGHVHIRSSKKGASGFFAMATYKLHEQQPANEDCYDNAKWQAWAQAQAKALKGAPDA